MPNRNYCKVLDLPGRRTGTAGTPVSDKNFNVRSATEAYPLGDQ